MLQFNPNDPGVTPYKLRRAVKESGLTLQQICDRMKADYGVVIEENALEYFMARKQQDQ